VVGIILVCLVAAAANRFFSGSLADFREIDGELDAVLRYEVEAANGQTV
jgi:hypothetical protein